MQYATPPAAPPTPESHEVGGLGLYGRRRADLTDDPSQPSRRRLVSLAAIVAVLVIAGTGVWLSLRQPAPSVQNSADRLDAPPPTTPDLLPQAAIERSEPSAQAPAAAVSPETAEPFDPAAADGQFVVQMATFRFETNAAKAAQEFRDAGFPAYSIGAALGGGDRGFAVFVGPYPSLNNAERERERAQQLPGYGVGRIVRVVSSQSTR